MSDPGVILPQNQDPPKVSQSFVDSGQPMAPIRARGGGGGSWRIIVGIIMLVAGIGLSVSGIGRVFIGLIVVGAINIIRGIASASNG